jgi:hypothetical protein
MRGRGHFIRRSGRGALTALACAAMLTVAQGVELSPGVEQLYASVSIYPPSATQMTVCYGFVCRRRYIWDITAGDRKALTQIMAAGKVNAASEREAVRKAIVWFDKRMGPILGTEKRVAKADVRSLDDNYDCWDTTRNTTSLLLVLNEWSLLRYHSVGEPRFRGYSVILQLPHNTAVLRERATGEAWAVDMWPHAYAQLPDVMTVEKWVKED